MKGSQLQEMLNQLIERLVEEGYLTLHEEPLTAQQRRETMGGNGKGESKSLCRATSSLKSPKKVWIFSATKRCGICSAVWARVPLGRHDTSHLATGVEAEAASKPYEFGDTINLDVNTTLLSAIQREGH